MKRLLLLAVLLAAAQDAAAASAPHPAVVRITALERGGASLGSGALVDVNDTYGLVVTNWHVVRDAAGPVLVTFPDGFCSAAKILATDRDWDLAALAIWRPNVRPIRLSGRTPRPGDLLTIAGYGTQGRYRSATGRCTQYVSPGGRHPHEMVELSAPARQGDSGGPILNDRGELAGVLFGTAFGRTTGSYCGRVGQFLASVDNEFRRLPARRITPAEESMIAGGPQLDPDPVVAIGGQPSASGGDDSLPAESVAGPVVQPRETPRVDASMPTSGESPAVDRAEQVKTILAAIGVLTLLYHGLRLLGAAAA